MRLTLLTLGGLTLALLWLGPFPELARWDFWAHMTLHMGVVAVAAPLLSLAIAGSRFDPVFRWPALFAPIPASVAELILVWAWHAPGLHHFARGEPLGFVLEQGSFLSCGVWLWLSAFGGDAARNSSRTGTGILGLLLTSMHMTLLGALLALSPRPLYRHGEVAPASPGWTAPSAMLDETGDRPVQRSLLEKTAAICLPPNATFGPAPRLTPLQDQHLGGAIMLLIGGASYLGGGLWLTLALLQPTSRNLKRA